MEIPSIKKEISKTRKYKRKPKTKPIPGTTTGDGGDFLLKRKVIKEMESLSVPGCVKKCVRFTFSIDPKTMRAKAVIYKSGKMILRTSDIRRAVDKYNELKCP